MRKGERIGYMAASTPAAELGFLLVAASARGVCAVLLGDDAESLLRELRVRFPAAELEEDAALGEQWLRVAEALCGEGAAAADLPLDLRGTAFQARVWAALLAIPRGETRTYTELADSLGDRRAVRAVAHACAQNPVAGIVPCHRVVGADGRLTGYRWGLARKRALLEREGATPPSLHGLFSAR